MLIKTQNQPAYPLPTCGLAIVKHYEGIRRKSLVIVTINGHRLNPRSDLCDSPVGFEWGYNGSGPKQLTIALLADFLGDTIQALALCHLFRRSVIAKLPHDHWTLTGNEIKRMLQSLS
jgi:hypothetical protein